MSQGPAFGSLFLVFSLLDNKKLALYNGEC